MTKTYIRKSQRIYEELNSILMEECFNENASQQFNKGAVDAMKTINISINNLLDNDDLYKINVEDIKNTDPEKHNFYYNKILTEIDETFLEQGYNYTVKNVPGYYITKELNEYDMGMTFIFLNARNYIKSCLVEENTDQDFKGLKGIKILTSPQEEKND